MPHKVNPFATDEDNPPLTQEMMARAKPTREFYAERGLRYPGLRGPQKAPTKVQMTLRLDRDVVEELRSGGTGWQRRANDILRRAVLPAAASRGGMKRSAPVKTHAWSDIKARKLGPEAQQRVAERTEMTKRSAPTKSMSTRKATPKRT